MLIHDEFVRDLAFQYALKEEKRVKVDSRILENTYRDGFYKAVEILNEGICSERPKE